MTDLEKTIIQTVNDGLSGAIKSRLEAGYHNSPLNLMIDEVVRSREDKLRKVIEGSVDAALEDNFKTALQEAITHKLARVLISKIEGELERRANELRSSPEFRARLTLAIEKAVKETK